MTHRVKLSPNTRMSYVNTRRATGKYVRGSGGDRHRRRLRVAVRCSNFTLYVAIIATLRQQLHVAFVMSREIRCG